jgi:hypothetical protein
MEDRWLAMLRNVLYRGPEDALIDCWTVVDRGPELRAVVAAAERTPAAASPPTARVPDLSVAADYMRWIDAEHGLKESGTIAAPDYEPALSA